MSCIVSVVVYSHRVNYKATGLHDAVCKVNPRAQRVGGTKLSVTGWTVLALREAFAFSPGKERIPAGAVLRVAETFELGHIVER